MKISLSDKLSSFAIVVSLVALIISLNQLISQKGIGRSIIDPLNNARILA